MEELLDGMAAELSPVVEGLAGDVKVTAELGDSAVAAGTDHIANGLDALSKRVGMNAEQCLPPAAVLDGDDPTYPAEGLCGKRQAPNRQAKPAYFEPCLSLHGHVIIKQAQRKPRSRHSGATVGRSEPISDDERMRANVSEGYRGTPYRRPLRKDGPWRPQGQSGIRSIRSIEISLSNNLVKRADEEGKLHLAQVREILEEAYPVAGTEPRNYLDSPWAWRPAHP